MDEEQMWKSFYEKLQEVKSDSQKVNEVKYVNFCVKQLQSIRKNIALYIDIHKINNSNNYYINSNKNIYYWIKLQFHGFKY